MATNTMNSPDLLGVRDTLTNKYGIDNARIGWDGQYVTIDGKQAIKPVQNIEGRTYADAATIANAVQPFQQNVVQPPPTGTSSVGPTPATPNLGQQLGDIRSQLAELFPQQQNPLDQQFSDLLAMLQGRVLTQQPISLEEVLASPQYAAQQAQAERQAQQATRAAQEALGAAGFGRSTRLADRAQGIQNEATEYLNTQVVPAIMQALQGDRDRQTAALMDLLGVVGQERAFQQQQRQSELDNLLNLLGFQTGREDVQYERDYRLGRDAIADRRYEDETAYARQRDEIADQRYAEERAYQMARDAIADERWKMQFDEDVRRFGLNYALDKARLNHQISDAAASRALQARNLALEERREQRLRESSNLDELYRQWEATGRAPAGIPGVAPGTPLYDPVAARQTQQPAEVSTNEILSEAVSFLDQMTPEQRQAFFQGERSNLIRDLGINGYNNLYRMYFDELGNPID